MKRLLIVFLLLTFISSLSAHEFWLSPEKFIYPRGENINVRFLVGENFSGENWRGNRDRVQSLKLYYGGVSDDISQYISTETGDSLQLTMLDEGIVLIAFNSTNSYIEMEADSFNKYLDKDGLTHVLDYRQHKQEMDSLGRELYQRCAKTLLQIGNVNDKTYSVNTGLPVEIIPLSNPYQLKNNDSLKVKILFRDEPLTGALIKTWKRENDSAITASFISDANGEIIFPVITKGKWMVSTVTMIRHEGDSGAQWQSYWSSLTWGYE
jgi:uncharacterized GH25 family protein